MTIPPHDREIARLAELAASGDAEAWTTIMAYYRDRLRRMVTLRLDRRLQGRVDASDVIQEASLEASRRLADYLKNPKMPFFLWLRYLTCQQIQAEYRKHVEAKSRDAGREAQLVFGALPETSTARLAAHLLGRLTSPSQAAVRAEQRGRVQQALNVLEPLDREILTLRHYEQLSNGEIATVLGLDKSAASKRYARALARLKTLLRTGGEDAGEGGP